MRFKRASASFTHRVRLVLEGSCAMGALMLNLCPQFKSAERAIYGAVYPMRMGFDECLAIR